MEAVKRGGDRQVLHEVIREHALTAWAALRSGGENPLIAGLMGDSTMLSLMPAEAIQAALKSDDYVGDAPIRARAVARAIRTEIGVQS